MQAQARRSTIINLFTHPFWLALFLAMGCRNQEPPPPLPERVTWDGHVPSAYQVEAVPAALDSAALLSGAEDSLGLRVHTLVFAGDDSVRLSLREFSKDYWAYAAFQKEGDASEREAGFRQSENSIRFYHGVYVGELRFNRAGLMPATFLKTRLNFQGEDLFLKPKAFNAFPMQGRLRGTESLIVHGFFGSAWKGPVFCIRYQCHADTAFAFRAQPSSDEAFATWMAGLQGQKDTVGWPREIHFQGWDEFHRPLDFGDFSGSVRGVSGCFDSLFVQQTLEKMKKMDVLWPGL